MSKRVTRDTRKASYLLQQTGLEPPRSRREPDMKSQGVCAAGSNGTYITYLHVYVYIYLYYHYIYIYIYIYIYVYIQTPRLLGRTKHIGCWKPWT